MALRNSFDTFTGRMQATCPSCHAAVPAADINIGAMTGLCRPCNNLFPLPREGDASIPAAPADSERPQQIEVVELHRGLRLSWRWWHPLVIFYLFFAIIWDSFLIFWYAQGASATQHLGFIEWLMIIFPLMHVAVGLALPYYVVASFCNRTVVEVDSQQVAVRVGPVPWIGNRILPRDRIRRLKITQTTHRNRQRATTWSRLMAETEPGGSVILIRSFLDSEQASFVARSLAAALSVPLISSRSDVVMSDDAE